MYSNTAAVLRPDLRAVVEQGRLNTDVFIGEQVAPVFPSITKSGTYPVMKPEISDTMDDNAAKRATGGGYPRLSPSYTSDTFDAVDIGVEEPIDDAFDRNDLGRFFDIEQNAAKRTRGVVQINFERAVASALMNTAFTATAAAVNYTETNIATINFLKDWQGAKRRLMAKGYYPNAIVLSDTLFDQIVRSTLFRQYLPGGVFKSDTSALAKPQDFSNVLQAPDLKVYVGQSYYNSALKTKALSASNAWGNTYIWIGYLSSGGDLFNGGAIRSIVWTVNGPNLWNVSTYRDEKIVSDIVRCNQYVAVKRIDPRAGEMITTSYSAS